MKAHKQSMVRILREDFQPILNGKRVIPELRDYIVVSRLSTFGQFKVVEMLPMETLAQLHILRNHLGGVKTHR